MANETLITDLVAQEALDQLADLDRAMEETYKTFADVGKELAKGLKIPVEVQGDLDELEKVYTKQMPRGAQVFPEITQAAVEQLGASLPTSIPRDKSTGVPVIINDYTDLQNQVIASTKTLARELRMQSLEMSKAMRQQAFAEYLKRRL